MCCSVRDKHIQGQLVPVGSAPQFESFEVEVKMERAVFASFAPLHQRQEVVQTRRIALASRTQVQVYTVSDMETTSSETTQFPVTHQMAMEAGQEITAILFPDEDSARHFCVAFGPAEDLSRARKEALIGLQVWSCEASWKEKEGSVALLEDHLAPITRLAASRAYLLSCDVTGTCYVYQKNKAYAKRATAQLHVGGVADLAADRLFVYSAGSEDRAVCVWALPDLTPVLNVPIDIPIDFMGGLVSPSSVEEPARIPTMPAPASVPDLDSKSSQSRLARLSLIRRPLSRWAGWQGSSRGPKMPRGVIFVAGVLGNVSDIAGEGAGVLMEWSLGEKPSCKNVQIAHESPIELLIYGPYDNGPLVTADAKGVFRVWEFQLEKGLRFSQQIELLCMANPGELTVCVEQPRGLYVTAGGRLFVWQRNQTN